ncbi:hypothetical protein COEREDRAFT_79810 [Coemansia reversa NRRL 1564]|uniref:TRIP4/RQT4 C2HC5-type zinc finger domain-containing protein n=1 Tax=Coemansia reversa (strain ATCC 12441 / NRRL 1564) TaxID=763665 RepID=A0A2G5BH38_COERN|nr:hypothetical protein COEREDRAFT_79810 [Coemansia reversa NRRL 1564]|eukprot:PIA18315.1 hypothetical protein COEREDRAFT_79810 [Coemansia reversa NRRL 1564]
MNFQRKAHLLTPSEQTWATQQIASIIGTTKDDAQPLAEFLIGIEDANELQGQLLDMLGESPLALDFAFALIAKRFPSEDSLPQQPQSQKTQEVSSPPTPLPHKNQKQQDTTASSTSQTNKQSSEPVYKSQRQIKREKQQKFREKKEEEERKRRLANRKRIKCECQATDHPLFTNCLTCGRIICESEGPGPCFFCNSNVESPDQQLQQHMRRLLEPQEHNNGSQLKQHQPTKSRKDNSTGGSSYLMKVGGSGSNVQEPQLLWIESKETSSQISTDNAKEPIRNASASENKETSEEEYMERAFRVLGIDKTKADAASIQEAESWVNATRRKERLLEFDRTAAQRTHLIDQSADFDIDAVSKWLSPEEKAAAEKRKNERAKSQEERESRQRRGMRVLRLNFNNASVEMRNAGESDVEKEGGNAKDATAKSAATLKAASQQPSPSQKKPQQHQADSGNFNSAGAFARNPLNKDSEPKFVLAPREPPAKAKKNTRNSRNKSKGQSIDAPACEALSLPPTTSSSSTTAADALAKQKLQLRIQSDSTELMI